MAHRYVRRLWHISSVAKLNNFCLSTSQLPLYVNELCLVRMFSTQDSQNSLPRLPVPPLEQTLQKYLKVVRPLVNDEEYEHTERIVDDFKKSPGPELQAILKKRAEERINWLTDWWRDVAYLNYRLPVIINSNPSIVFPQRSFSDKAGQLRFAAKLVEAVLNYKSILDEGRLPVQMLGGKALCMSQFKLMFGSCRIPGEITDSCVLHSSSDPNPPRHITVFHNNQIFSLDVYGSDNRPLNTDQLYEQLTKIVESSQTAAPPVGVLTMTDRTSWAKTYKKIIKDRTNLATMEDIQRSIMVLSLDGPWDSVRDESERLVSLLHQMMHGVGKQFNYAGNRWFDKTLQVIVGENGTSGINFEHTPCDGPPLVDIIDFVNEYCDADHVKGTEAAGVAPPRKMHLNLTDDVLHDIQTARQHGVKQADDVSLLVSTYDGYGKEFPKAQGLSPDGYVQTILQLAYYRMYGKPCATYESGSLRRFQLGRTDTIRSCSVDSFNFTKAMMDGSLSCEVKADLFRKAVMAHRKYTDEVVSGNGIDRHLLGLKLAASEAGLRVPDLHTDPTFAKAFHFNLSTSQLVIRSDTNVIFGAVVPDGYGVFYTIKKSSIVFSVSAYHSCPSTDVHQMVKSLKQSLDDVQALLASPKSKI